MNNPRSQEILEAVEKINANRSTGFGGVGRISWHTPPRGGKAWWHMEGLSYRMRRMTIRNILELAKQIEEPK